MRKTMMTVAVCAAAAGVGAWAMGIAQGMDATADTVVVSPAITTVATQAPAVEQEVEQQARALEARIERQARALDVGDADSFGRPVRWLGYLSTKGVQLRDDCTPMPGDPADMQCMQIDGPSGSGYSEFRDMTRMTLPGGSLNSVLCPWLSPSMGGTFGNLLPYDNREASLTLYPSLTLESEVLRKLSLVNPDTGQPMDGTLELLGSSSRMSLLLDSGERLNQVHTSSRTCIGGQLTRRTLVEYYGLTDHQVDRVFARPITLRLNMAVVANGLMSGYASYGVRFVGD